ncbi:hypothetical protein LOZ65_004626 [Ophidiomyces ophidiicola]|nr:hypothetical protein LOZ65_004626 [Ophidiomyces ophidiicola]
MIRRARFSTPTFTPSFAVYSTSRRIKIPSQFPVTSSCPEPTCPCAETPAGLDIDHEQNLHGTMASYSQHLLIATGQPDWKSRIEEDGPDQSWGILARRLKKLLGRGGKYSDPYNNILITNSSFKPQTSDMMTASAFLFPGFQYLPEIPLDETDLDTFVRAYLLPLDIHRAHDILSPEKQESMRRALKLQSTFTNVVKLTSSPTILICGHGHRDRRCGIMGSLLQAEFRRVLRHCGFSVDPDRVEGAGHANVELISHIGGHKYAGNVIIYVPPSMGLSLGAPSALAGKGIWYGRVEPKHVEGIVKETILNGRIIIDHFRGGIDENGILRL